MPPETQKEPSTFGDSSRRLFSLYSEIATEEDDKKIDRWQKDADGILVFTGLFSAAVAGMLAMSIGDLKPDPQETSAFYLANMYLLYSHTNGSPIPSYPDPFSPPRYAVCVNSLWFMSLVISLTCVLLATSLQQWTRRYIENTQPKQCPPQGRARKRAFFAIGMDEALIPLPWAVEVMPALLHLSVFLFLAGLLIFLFYINKTVFIPITSLIGFFLSVYVCITLMPIVRPSSLYRTPFSLSIFFLCALLAYLCSSCLAWIMKLSRKYDAYFKHRGLKERLRYWMSEDHRNVVQNEILAMESKIDLHILDWTLHALGGDDSQERFFRSIPGFFESRLVQDLRRGFSYDHAKPFMETLHGFLNRTLSSNSIPKEDRNSRLEIYKDVMNVIPGPIIRSPLIDHAFGGRRIEDLQSTDMGKTFVLWFENADQKMSRYAQERVVRILSSVDVREPVERWIALAARGSNLSDPDFIALQGHVERWKALAARGFNSPDPDLTVIQKYISSPDDVLLYFLNHVMFEATLSDSLSASSSSILSILSELDTSAIHDDLRREFCHLWDINKARAYYRGVYRTPIEILRRTHRLFFNLHRATDVQPTKFTADTDDDDQKMFEFESYPKCTLLVHLNRHPVRHPHTSCHYYMDT